MSHTPTSDGPSSDRWVGQVVGDRYAITERIARGSMGCVYAAVHNPLGRKVALKVLDVQAVHSDGSDTGAEQKYRKRFLREASLLSRLTHPNTVRVFDYGLHEDTPYIVMEYIEGRTLRELLRTGRLDPLRAVHIAQQVCGALGEAHDLGLVHRDLKPANVLVNTSEHGDLVKVVDFGLVKDIQDSAHMTAEHVVIGTPMYMGPEQIRGEEVDQRTDIYALGVMMYRMLSGRAPFAESQTTAVLVAHLTDIPPRFAQVDPEHGVHEQLEWVVQRCLEKDPDRRFSDVRELTRALQVCEGILAQNLDTATSTMSIERGRLVVPPALDVAPSAEVVDARMVRRIRRRRVFGRLFTFVAVCVGMMVALCAGFIGVRAALALRSTPVAVPAPLAPAPVAPVQAAPPAPPVAPTPAPVEEPEPVEEAAAEPEAIEVAPEPAPRPRPRPRPRPAPKPAPAPVAPAPVESPDPDPDARDPGGNDLVDPWSETPGDDP